VLQQVASTQLPVSQSAFVVQVPAEKPKSQVSSRSVLLAGLPPKTTLFPRARS
jgi:hypothetical protein